MNSHPGHRVAGRPKAPIVSARGLAGLLTVVALVAVAALAVALFRSSFTKTVPVTVISDRAGLVMNPDAKVKMRGVQVGKVDSIENRPDGTAALHLALDPDKLRYIPENVDVNIASQTVFGSKFVEFVAPSGASAKRLQSGQVLDAQRVTVEINTVFQQLVTVLDKIDPAKLNQTLGALSKAFKGRGKQFGQSLTDFDQWLAKIDPSLSNLAADIESSAPAFGGFADASPDLLTTAGNTSRISGTLVEKQGDLDSLLLSVTGFADLGQEVLSDNRQGLTDVVHLLAPTTALLGKYHEDLGCGIAGIAPFASSPPLPDPGVVTMVSFNLGIERYRFPQDLPKVAAKTQVSSCKAQGLPNVPFEFVPPSLVTDVGANPWRYGNQGILLNSDGLKQFLFGPIDGPPRTSFQGGMPG